MSQKGADIAGIILASSGLFIARLFLIGYSWFLTNRCSHEKAIVWVWIGSIAISMWIRQ